MYSAKMGAGRSNTSRQDLLVPTRAGLYCPAGDFHIDPVVGVDCAVITHAHADHARPGSRRYLASMESLPLLRERLGNVVLEGLEYGRPVRLGEAWVSLHPAGHILGSAQVRVEVGTQVWVHAGDYKRDPDPTCAPFEVVPCDTFITEATFGLPIYRWPPVGQVAADVLRWWDGNRAAGKVSALLCYSLGKAQRMLVELGRLTAQPVQLHPQVEAMTAHYRAAGVRFGPTELLASSRQALQGALVILPPAAARTQLAGLDVATGFVSGWMAVPKRRRGSAGFVVSDHADWPALVATARDTGARRVLVTHGDGTVLVRYLREQLGVDAQLLAAAG